MFLLISYLYDAVFSLMAEWHSVDMDKPLRVMRFLELDDDHCIASEILRRQSEA